VLTASPVYVPEDPRVAAVVDASALFGAAVVPALVVDRLDVAVPLDVAGTEGAIAVAEDVVVAACELVLV